MEAGGESGNRHSRIPSGSNPTESSLDHRSRDLTRDRGYTDGPAMATATLISPSNSYHPHQNPSSFPSGYAGHAMGATTNPPPSGMISPVDTRRTSDDDPAHRRSLPSIQEVISGTKPSHFGGPPVPPAMSAPQSLPSPFSTNGSSRSFPDTVPEKHPSPRTLHPATTFPRHETLPAFSDPARPSFASRPPGPPPLPGFSSAANPPGLKLNHLEGEQRREEVQPPPPAPNGAYPQHPTSHAGPPPIYAQQQGQLPQGQMPLSVYPASPGHAGPPPLPSPYDAQRPPMFNEEGGEFGGRGKYESTLERHFEAWTYGEALSRISTSARTIYHFAEAFETTAREQQGSQPIPSRLPTEAEVSLMLDNVYMLKKHLEDVRAMVQQSRMNSERARETGSRKSYEDEDVPMYGEAIKAQYGSMEVKKRRGRAAPPGRCHSCNRIDTPEWRRGPDGARTLCNACGLHYAKLERKRQHDLRTRPKPQIPNPPEPR